MHFPRKELNYFAALSETMGNAEMQTIGKVVNFHARAQ